MRLTLDAFADRAAAASGALALAVCLSAGGAAAQTFSGTGPFATPPFVLNSGRTHFVIEAGPAPFEAFLIADDGSVVARLGPQGSDVSVPRSGRYLLDIRAAGPWSIAVTGTAPDARAETLGRIEGAEAAAGAPAGWLARGLGAGLILGPIGTVLVTNRADETTAEDRAEADRRTQGHEPAYSQAFRDAFLEQRRSGRRTAALVGGLTGTAILGFVILQATVWGDDPQASGNPPGNGNPAIRIPISIGGVGH